MNKVLIVGCTHGTEKVGLKVIDYLRARLAGNENLNFLIANPKAMAANVRFLETDLNRSFPGRVDGSFEERLACEIYPLVASYDYVIDIHSTQSGLKSAVILTTVNDETLALARCTNAKHVLHMKITQDNALISSAKVGIGLEFGPDEDSKTYKDTLNAICLILSSLGHIAKTNAKPTARKIFLRISEGVPKPEGFVVKTSIKNYKRVACGQVYGRHPLTKEVLKAEEDFYPILFGKNTYTTIFGFKGKRILEVEEKLRSR